MNCTPECLTASKPPVGFTNGCGKKRAPGGIPRLLFLICDPNHLHPVPVDDGVSPWTSLENIEAAMCAGLLNFTGPVLGSMPKPTTETKQMDSCGPEEVVGGTTVINFQDYNVTENLDEFVFWDWVKKSYDGMSFGWITCDELLYMYEGDFAPNVGPVHDPTKKGNRFFDGTISMETSDLIFPIRVPGILSLLARFNPENCYS